MGMGQRQSMSFSVLCYIKKSRNNGHLGGSDTLDILDTRMYNLATSGLGMPMVTGFRHLLSAPWEYLGNEPSKHQVSRLHYHVCYV